MWSGYMVQECMAGYAATAQVRDSAQLGTRSWGHVCEHSASACKGGGRQSSPHLVIFLLEEALHQGRPLLQAFPQPLLQVRAPSLHVGIPKLSCHVTLLHCLTAVCLAGNPQCFIQIMAVLII